MDIVTRLKAYMDHVGLQISQFADLAQIPRPTLSQILSGRNKKISNELLSKLHAAFPALNISWLLFGDGDMDTVPLTGNASPAPKNANVSVNQLIESHPAVGGNDNKASKQQLSAAMAADNEAPRLDFSYNADAESDRLKENKSTVVQTKKDSAQPQLSLTPDSTKKIQNIMVFYSDNSFEIFTPSVQ